MNIPANQRMLEALNDVLNNHAAVEEVRKAFDNFVIDQRGRLRFANSARIEYEKELRAEIERLHQERFDLLCVIRREHAMRIGTCICAYCEAKIDTDTLPEPKPILHQMHGQIFATSAYKFKPRVEKLTHWVKIVDGNYEFCDDMWEADGAFIGTTEIDGVECVVIDTTKPVRPIMAPTTTRYRSL